jgi:hypothetical protein
VEAVRLANGLRPDLVVLLGDYVDATAEAIHELAPTLARLNARFGIFGVLANHDHWKGAKVVRRALAAEGISVFRNSGVTLPADGGDLFLAGLGISMGGPTRYRESARCTSRRTTHDPPRARTGLCGHYREGRSHNAAAIRT